MKTKYVRAFGHRSRWSPFKAVMTVAVLTVMSCVQWASAQSKPSSITNADVIHYQQIGLSNESIINLVAEAQAAGLVQFDLRAEALADLAHHRVSPEIVNLMQTPSTLRAPAIVDTPTRSVVHPRSMEGAKSALARLNEVTERSWEIVEVDAKVTESNSVWWKYASKVTVQNYGPQPITIRATVGFQDAEGFIVDADDSEITRIGAGDTVTMTGYDLVTAKVAGNVAKTHAKVRQLQ